MTPAKRFIGYGALIRYFLLKIVQAPPGIPGGEKTPGFLHTNATSDMHVEAFDFTGASSLRTVSDCAWVYI
jgi:hypothetical protein